jgi:hypothetical protein
LIGSSLLPCYLTHAAFSPWNRVSSSYACPGPELVGIKKKENHVQKTVQQKKRRNRAGFRYFLGVAPSRHGETSVPDSRSQSHAPYRPYGNLSLECVCACLHAYPPLFCVSALCFCSKKQSIQNAELFLNSGVKVSYKIKAMIRFIVVLITYIFDAGIQLAVVVDRAPRGQVFKIWIWHAPEKRHCH